MILGADENHPLDLVLALVLTIQAQIKEKWGRMTKTTITQILPVGTQFGDNQNKYEEENEKLKSAG